MYYDVVPLWSQKAKVHIDRCVLTFITNRIRGETILLRFALKNVFRKKSIAILSSLGIGFGLMLQFVLGGFSAGVTASVESNFQAALGRIEITEYGEIGATSELPRDVLDVLLSADFADDIQSYNVKTELAPKFTLPYFSQLPNSGDSIVIIGVNQTLDVTMDGATANIINGTSFRLGEDEIILDSRLYGLATGFSKDIGSTFPVYINVTVEYNMTVVGNYDQPDNGAPSFVPRKYFAYTSIETAWKLLQLEGDLSGAGYFTQIDLQFPPVSNNATAGYIEEIKALSDANAFGGVFIEAFSLGAFQESIGDTLGILSTFTSVIGFITLLAGGMAIIVSQLNSVTARMKEFAILKSTGWKNSHIFKNVVYESTILGGVGAIIGLVLGFLLIGFIGSAGGIFGTGSGEVIVTIELVIQLVAFALGIGIIGGLYPAAKAAGVRPVKVLKGE